MSRMAEWIASWARKEAGAPAEDADAAVSCRWGVAAAIGAFVLVVCVVLWYVWFHHYVKAWSDPLNWLRFARHFGQEFAASRFPAGYPIFLRLVLDMVGPYWVFLANVPVMLCACLLCGLLARRALASGSVNRGLGAAAVVVGFAIAVALDPGMLVLLANPYRDPLSYVYLFGSMLLLIGYLEDCGHRLWRLACSGLLMGAAYSVREPSVLMLAPMGLCGLLYWWKDRKIVLWKSVLVFGLFVLVGAAPIIVQSILKSGTVLPPQVTVEKGQVSTGICGLHFTRLDILAANWGRMLDAYGQVFRWLLVPFVLAIGFAWRERNRVMLALVMPGALLYAVFYLFYYAFVHRYFHVALLFMAMVAAYGLCRATAFAVRWVGERFAGRVRPAQAWAVGACLLLVLGLALSFWRLVPRGARPEAFRFGMARALGATIERHLPVAQNPVVLCRRNLCELIEWFCNVDSHDVPFYDEDEGGARGDALRLHVKSLMAGGRRVFLFDFPHEGSEGRDSAPVTEMFDLEKVTDVSFKGCLPPAWTFDVVPLYEVKAWTNRVVEAVLPRPPGGGWLEVRAGRLWGPATQRAYARLMVDGVVVTNRLADGFNVFPLPASDGGTALVVRVESDEPLAGRMPMRTKGFDDELVYDLYYYSSPFAAEVTGPDVIDARPGRMPYPAVVGMAELKVWAPLPPPGEARVMGIGLSSDDIDDWPPDGVDFLLGTNLLGSCKVERVREERRVQFVVGAEAGELLDIRIQRRAWSAAPLAPVKEAPGGSTLVRRARFGYVNEAGTAIAFVPGRVGDLYLMRGGFWHLEFFDGHRPGFWTKGRARLWLPLAPPQGDAVLTMAISTRQRPPEAAAADLRVTCNGHPIAMTMQSEDAETGVRIEKGVVPMAWLSASNDVELVCTPWRPRDYGSADPRELGVVVHRVAIEAKASGAGEL